MCLLFSECNKLLKGRKTMSYLSDSYVTNNACFIKGTQCLLRTKWKEGKKTIRGVERWGGRERLINLLSEQKFTFLKDKDYFSLCENKPQIYIAEL